MNRTYDVAIVGGGPAGSTVGSLLKKYEPGLRVAIFERERFPREHIGESLLPTVSRVLHEIGAWDKIEAAGFPIKVGATYRWGSSDDLWDFNLLDTREVVEDAPRPAAYDGWRVRTAFQVERSRFDQILLDHSREMGCEVFEECGVVGVDRDEHRISQLWLSDGSSVAADTYVDASGGTAVIRRALGVEVEEPAALKNIAIWDYWENAEWAVSIGKGATRVQVMSLGYGWIWFIPISPTRTSIGLVCPAEYYKKTGKRPEDLYLEAVRTEPRVAALIANATPSGETKATKDWSFLASRVTGPNWYLVGEAAGFADPILAAGITMTVIGAKECAYTILELRRGGLERDWVIDSFEARQRRRVSQHIQFANFWYSANAHFTDLMDFTAEIAKQAGLKMDAKTAWQWLGTGGFVSLETAGAGLAGHSLEQIKNLQQMMFNEESEWAITKVNVFELDLTGTEIERSPLYHDGKIRATKVFKRDGKDLPYSGGFRVAIDLLQNRLALQELIAQLRAVSRSLGPHVALAAMEAIDAMLREGWVKGEYDPGQPLLTPKDIPRTPNVDWNRDRTDPRVRVNPVLSDVDGR